MGADPLSTVKLWELADDSSMQMEEQGLRLEAVHYSPNGTYLIATTVHPQKVIVVDATTFEILKSLPFEEEWITSATMSPDERYLAVCFGLGSGPTPDAKVIDWTSGDEVEIRPPADLVAFHTSKNLLMIQRPLGIAMIDLASRKQVGTLRTRGELILAIDRQGQRIALSDNGFCVFIDSQTGVVLASAQRPLGIRRNSRGVFSDDGTKLISHSIVESTAVILETSNATTIADNIGHSELVTSASFIPDGTRAITTSYDGTLKLWDSNTGDLVLTLDLNEGPVRSAEFNPSGEALLVCTDRVYTLEAVPWNRESWSDDHSRELLIPKVLGQSPKKTELSPDYDPIRADLKSLLHELEAIETGRASSIIVMKGGQGLLLKQEFPGLKLKENDLVTSAIDPRSSDKQPDDVVPFKNLMEVKTFVVDLLGRLLNNVAQDDYFRLNVLNFMEHNEVYRTNPLLPLRYRGEEYFSEGKFAEAHADWERALAFDDARDSPLQPGLPDWIDVANALAYSLATCPDASLRDSARAAELARQVAAALSEIAPDDLANSGSHFNYQALGVTQYLVGDFSEAIATLQRSSWEWDGPFYLAMAHWRLGDEAEAKKILADGIRDVERNPPEDEDWERLRAEAEALIR